MIYCCPDHGDDEPSVNISWLAQSAIIAMIVTHLSGGDLETMPLDERIPPEMFVRAFAYFTAGVLDDLVERDELMHWLQATALDAAHLDTAKGTAGVRIAPSPPQGQIP